MAELPTSLWDFLENVGQTSKETLILFGRCRTFQRIRRISGILSRRMVG